MKPGIALKIANTEETAFLLQAELNSIERGSFYVENMHNEIEGSTLRGYLNHLS
jgi:hypothetical protein